MAGNGCDNVGTQRMVSNPRFNIRGKAAITYLYVGTALLITVLSTATILQVEYLLYFTRNYRLLCIFMTFVALSITNALLDNIRYDTRTNTKTVVWSIHAALLGPQMTYFPEEILIKSLFCTLLLVISLTFVACLDRRNLSSYLVDPLSALFALITASTIFSVLLGVPKSLIGVLLLFISLHGGFFLYCGLMIVNTQRLLINLRSQTQHFDPIYMSVVLYINIVNLFLRIATFSLLHTTIEKPVE